MTEALLAPAFLFRYSLPCYRLAEPQKLWESLEERHTLPNFGELEGRPRYAELRGGWSESGLAISLRVVGKRHPPWCRETRLDDSDGLQLFLDTRDTHNIHRAGRFCHRFIMLPGGTGKGLKDPCVALVPINRARENPKPIDRDQIKCRSESRVDGYLLEAFIPSGALTGYDPSEHSRLGFSYAVFDRELGIQTLAIGVEFPILEDPSLWGTLELV